MIACGGVGFLGEICDTSAEAVRRPGEPPPIPVVTMNHIKYYHTDLDSALEWYLRLTDMRIVTYQEPESGPRTEGYEGRPIPVLRVGDGYYFNSRLPHRFRNPTKEVCEIISTCSPPTF